MKKVIFSLGFIFSTCTFADIVQFVPSAVMAGDSSAFSDGVWIKVNGKIGHDNCYYAPQNVSLFFSKPNSSVSPEKVLSIALAAKMAEKQLVVVYANDLPAADFWGFGISKCQIERLSIQ